MLAVRPRAVAEMTRRLARLGYPAALIEEVVTRLIEMGYLDDEAFARNWVESRDRARPRGSAGLKHELSLKGVERDVIEAILAERADASDTDADQQAAEVLLARRRHALEREIDPRRRRQKAYALLARNGFGPETCRTVSAAFVVEAEP